MSATDTNQPLQNGQSPASDRLESWKDIANYLNRSVRTAQRWEREEGLPVHRHHHEKRGTVYTFKLEVDAWWQSRRAALENGEQERVTKAPASRLQWWALPAGIAAAAIVALGITFWKWNNREPVLPFAERDWVLITDFDNRTGEEVLDGTLDYALERELSNSQFVNVVPRPRIDDALRLMQAPLDRHIDAAVGREIALRDGGIGALLVGRVEKLDSTYILTVSLIGANNGATVASFEEHAAGEKELLPAIRHLSDRVRETVGEHLPDVELRAAHLEKVTTPSLSALQLYSQGTALVDEHKFQHAVELLERAVEVDPEFASAHILLAHCYSNLDQEERAAPHFEKAFELASNTTNRERYFILGSYYSRQLKDMEKAIQAYEVLVRMYPDHYWGINNLVLGYRRTNRNIEALPFTVRLAELRPNDLNSNFNAYSSLFEWGEDPEQAQLYLERARRLLSADTERDYPYAHAAVSYSAVAEDWQQGNIEKVYSEVKRLSRNVNSNDGRVSEAWTFFASEAYTALGKLRTAEELARKYSGSRFQDRTRAINAILRESSPLPKTDLDHVGETLPNWILRPVLLARSGLLTEAEEAVSRIEKRNQVSTLFTHPIMEAVRGELALARGQRSEAIRILSQAMENIDHPRLSYLAADSLAAAYQREGLLEEAVAVLEAVGPTGNVQDFFLRSAPFWMKAQVRLAELYRQVGRVDDAVSIQNNLRKLLAYADSDHPILRRLPPPPDASLAQNRMRR